MTGGELPDVFFDTAPDMSLQDELLLDSNRSKGAVTLGVSEPDIYLELIDRDPAEEFTCGHNDGCRPGPDRCVYDPMNPINYCSHLGPPPTCLAARLAAMKRLRKVASTTPVRFGPLRAFRDEFLSRTRFGREYIGFYGAPVDLVVNLRVSSPFGGESRRLPGRRAGSGPRRPPPGPAGRTDVLGRAGQALQEDAAYGALRLAQRRGRERQRLRPVDPGVYGAPAHRELSAHRVLRKFRDASVAPKPAQLQAQRGRWSSISPPNRPERRFYYLLSGHARLDPGTVRHYVAGLQHAYKAIGVLMADGDDDRVVVSPQLRAVADEILARHANLQDPGARRALTRIAGDLDSLAGAPKAQFLAEIGHRADA